MRIHFMEKKANSVFNLVLPNSVINLEMFQTTFFPKSVEIHLVSYEKVDFFLRTIYAALDHIFSDNVVFSPKTAI